MKDMTHLLLPEVRELLAEGETEAIRDIVPHLHPADLADLLENLPGEQAARAFDLVEGPRKVETFEHLEEADRLALVEEVGLASMAGVISRMSSDDRADLAQALPEATRERLFPLLARAERADLKRLLDYPEGSAGAVMSTEYAVVRAEQTVREALDHLRRVAPDRETIYYVYVTDEDRRLRGVVSLTELITARRGQPVSEVMKQDVVSIPVDATVEEVARASERYDFLALPVVDGRERIVGIVTHDDVLDLVQDIATEDAQLLGAMTPLDEPYLRAGFFSVVWKRVVWLSVIFVGQMFTITALEAYEAEFTRMASLVLFIPLVISSGGNSGSQSVTLITRSLAVGEIGLRDWLSVCWRELAVGLALGLALGGIGFLRVLAGGGEMAGTLGLVVGLTLVGVVLVGSLSGALAPLLLKKIGLDPAVASAPFVASLIDVTGIVIYFNVAVLILA